MPCAMRRWKLYSDTYVVASASECGRNHSEMLDETALVMLKLIGDRDEPEMQGVSQSLKNAYSEAIQVSGSQYSLRQQKSRRRSIARACSRASVKCCVSQSNYNYTEIDR